MDLTSFIDNIERRDTAYDTKVETINDNVNEIDDESNDYDHTILYSELKRNNTFGKLTNFSEAEINDLLQQYKPFAQAAQTRGAPSKLNWIDSFILLLIFYRSGSDFTELSGFLKIPSTTLLKSVYKIRPLVNLFLKEKWNHHRDSADQRPKPFPNVTFPYVALSFDHTSIEILKPTGTMKDSKVFYDNKNKIYALKKGVACLSNSPHYAVFISPSVLGSVHDFQDFKSTFPMLLSYLKKTEEEKNMIPHDSDHPYWGISLDKGYCGSSNLTPNLRKIVPYKKPATDIECAHNEAFKSIHPIERFFGRMKKIWRITSIPYKYDLQYFNDDIDNCIYLTNEHIKTRNLEMIDFQYQRQLIKSKIDHVKSIQNKRKLQQEEYRKRIKSRIVPNDHII